MPNWCENQLWISHEDDNKIKDLIDSIRKGEFLNSLIPMDPKLLESDEWYDWRIKNWGCKWDINPENICSDDLEEYQEGDSEIYLDFLSAWSPPIQALQKALSAGFNITLRYNEPGLRFMGLFIEGEDYCKDY